MDHQTSLFAQASIAMSVSLAVFFYGGPTQLFQLGVVAIALVALVVHLIRCLQRRSLPWSAVHNWLLVYVLLLTLNVFTSIYPENTRVVVWMFLVLPIVVLIAGRLTSLRWHRLLAYLTLPIALSAGWGIAEFFASTGRASGPGVDPNSWASSLNMAFFLFASAYFVLSSRWLPIVFALLLLIATASFMAYSRVGLLVFSAALLFVSVVALSQHHLRRRAIILLVAVASCYGGLQLYRSAEVATQHSEGYTLNADAYGWALRFAQWRSALDQYSDYPVFGSGLGTFKVLYPTYRSLVDKKTAGNYVHNDFLQLLTETGPGIVALVVLFVGCLLAQMFLSVKRLLFDSRTEDDAKRREFETLVLIVAIGTVLVHAMMNFTLYSLLNQILIACALARLLALQGAMKSISIKMRQVRLGQFATVFIAGYLLVVTIADAVSHDLVFRGGVIPLDRQNPDDQYRVFEILSFIRGFRGETSANRFAMATFYRTSLDAQPVENVTGRRSLAIAAAIEYQSGLEINPYSIDARLFLQNFLEENPWLMNEPEIYQTPEKLLRGGLALFPLRIRDHVLLADFLQRTERKAEAYQLLQDALPMTQLRYDQYQVWRIVHQRMLLREATQRGDRAALEALLEQQL